MLALLSDRARFRQLVGGVCLIAAPLALFAGTVVHPGLSKSAPALLRIVAAHPNAWYATHILGWAFVVLMIPATFALLHLLGERQVALGHIGATLTVVGLVGFAGIVTAYGFVAGQMVTGGNQAEMAALFDRLTHNTGVFGPLQGMTAALIPGFGCLALGLWRAHAVPRWQPPLFFVGVVGFGFGMAAANTLPILVGTALMTVGLGAIGLRVLRSPLADSEVPSYALIGGDAHRHGGLTHTHLHEGPHRHGAGGLAT